MLAGAGGTGVLVARNARSGVWSSPAFYTLAAASIELQIGASSSEVMLLILTDRGLEAILKNRFKVGVDASAAVGPVGVGAQGATTSKVLDVDVVSFTRSKGLFAGVSFEGAVLQPQNRWNETYYRRACSPSEILLRHAVHNPGATALVEALGQLRAP